ncbi:MAG: hypothetical protein GY797_27335 [Deltaproteobacteria bacterium]|nr:hypothetical protein [Deltaproteobacteria bacterium]
MNSSLPIEISHPIEVALKSMQSHPQHQLLPYYRRAIYKGIEKAVGPKAHKIKAWLSILATQHVSSYWRIPLFMVREDEDDYDYWLHIPNHLIKIAKGIINGTIDSDGISKEVGHLSEVNDFTGQMDDSPYYHEWCVFKAALSCVWKVLNSDSRKPLETDDGINMTTTDENLIRYHCPDTALWACLAYTDGTWTPTDPEKWTYDKQQNRWMTEDEGWYFEDYGVWNQNTEQAIARRQEFWEWWLSQAVNEAWYQAQ